MTWTKTPDDYPDRLLELSDAAYRLHHAATVYSNRIGSDGHVQRIRLSMVPVPAKAKRPRVVQELVTAGLWQPTDDGWLLIDFMAAQLSAEEVQLQRQWDVKRQQIRFAKTAEERQERRAESDAIRDALHAARERRKDGNSQPVSLVNSLRPVPLRPVPSRSAPSESEDEDEAAALARSPSGRAGPPDENTCVLCRRAFDRLMDPIEYRSDLNGYVHPTYNDCQKAKHRTCFKCTDPFEPGPGDPKTLVRITVDTISQTVAMHASCAEHTRQERPELHLGVVA